MSAETPCSPWWIVIDCIVAAGAILPLVWAGSVAARTGSLSTPLIGGAVATAALLAWLDLPDARKQTQE